MDNTLTFEIEADEIEVFLQDVDEHLAAMEAGILSLEQNGEPAYSELDPKVEGQVANLDVLNATFRAAHTIKAVAATVGHRQMAELTHTLETLFDAMREGRLSPTQEVTDELLATVDVLKAMRDEVVTLQPSGIDSKDFLVQLRALTDADDDNQSPGFSGKTRFPGERQSWLTPEQATQVQDYHEKEYEILEIKVTTYSDAFAQSARLLQVSMALMEIGHVITQQPSHANLTNDQHSGHLWLILATQTDIAVIEETLSQVSDLAEFRVQPYSASTKSRPMVDRPAAATFSILSPPSSTLPTVRISVERLDTLMNLVGELVTDRTRLIQVQDMLHAKYGKSGIINTLGDMTTHFERVVDQLQEEVMAARMLPISHLLQKFPRLVRDLARASGKQVNLIIEGEATELDRSIIETISDPLIHLLRNAVDHGLEPPQERIAAGKPPTGTVWLTAAHEEGHIVITVKDDGQGIDPERIRRSAKSCGMLSEEEAAQLDDEAATNLIFQPNFSTAEQVTDVSGRGVGLDVVRTNIKKLSGSVVVESKVGRGTTFRVTLPLTLAIVQAMMVTLGNDVYAIPLTSIIESLYLSSVRTSSVRGRPVITWRNQVLPVVNLRRFFAHHQLPSESTNGKEQAVVAVAWGKLKAGLIVDKLIGKQEIVVKSLGSFIGNVTGLSGCTILGDGRIALIIDIPGLISATTKKANLALSGL
ncbi:MAG: chemotaxis protein CheA [Chloroflexota bacterium]|nr:chemotaxis protein CheA [Chloroflexota bacterium]